MFADNKAIITQNLTLKTSVRNLHNSLDELSLTFFKMELTLNPAKSEAKLFNLRKYINPTLIQINNQDIQ